MEQDREPKPSPIQPNTSMGMTLAAIVQLLRTVKERHIYETVEMPKRSPEVGNTAEV